MSRKKILILTTSVFTDRIYQHSTFLDSLKKEFVVEVWARSFISNPDDWRIEGIEVKPIPEVNQLNHWVNILRRINEFAWMYRLKAKSLEINLKYKRNHIENTFKKFLGKLISFFHLHILFEKFLHALILEFSRNVPIEQRLKNSKANYLLVSNPFWVEEPLIALEANKLKIPVISVIPSWDNITTKSRIIYHTNAYGVWSDIRLQELVKYYPDCKAKPQFIYGTPQYDIFRNPGFVTPKDSFYTKYQLDQQVPILLFTLGSPLFIPSEITVCLEFCKRALESGLLNHYQILIRPHPIKDFSEYLRIFAEIDERIKIQADVQTSSKEKFRYQDTEMIKNWVSTFYYSEIIIATSSTTILDASMMNKKHINIAANLTEDRNLDSFLHDVSFGFEHLQTLNRKNLLNNILHFEELFNQLQENITNPNRISNHSAEIVQHLAEYENKGNYGEIFSTQLTQVIHQLTK
jgi:hypothetical protein